MECPVQYQLDDVIRNLAIELSTQWHAEPLIGLGVTESRDVPHGVKYKCRLDRFICLSERLEDRVAVFRRRVWSQPKCEPSEASWVVSRLSRQELAQFVDATLERLEVLAISTV